jgi:threonine dehydratase
LRRNPAESETIAIMKLIAGVDGCKAGWIAVIFPKTEPKLAALRIFETFRDVVVALPADSIIAVDMPIGLPDLAIRGGRALDWAARELLGRRRASVFPVPSRCAVTAFDLGYAQVCEVARETSEPPRAPSKQAYHIFPRICEIDALLRLDRALRGRVFEVHPEVAFALMNGGPLAEPKKTKGRGHAPGLEHREVLLHDRGFDVAALTEKRPRGAGRDDLLDACACAWSAGRIASGVAESLPDPPGTDGQGLPVVIRARAGRERMVAISRPKCETRSAHRAGMRLPAPENQGRSSP